MLERYSPSADPPTLAEPSALGRLPLKRTAFLLTLLASLSLSAGAGADHVRPVHDLSSLAFESEVVVLVRADGAALVVDRVLGGQGLKVGERVEADGTPSASDVGAEPAILFLKRVGNGADARWSVVESSERITVDGRVLREVQEPGRLNMTTRRRPVGVDPLDVRGPCLPFATPRVRAAALRAFARDDAMRPSERPLLWDRWSSETEPEVQLEMMFLARRPGAKPALDPARATEPVVFAERRGRRVHFAWDGWSKPWRLVGATVEAFPKGTRQGASRALASDDLHCWGRDELSNVCEGDYDVFDAPPSEDLDVSLEVALERNGETVRRVVPLAPRAASRRQPVAAPPPLEPAASTPIASQPTEPAPGCSCDVAAATKEGNSWWAFLVAASAAWVRVGTGDTRRWNRRVP